MDSQQSFRSNQRVTHQTVINMSVTLNKAKEELEKLGAESKDICKQIEVTQEELKDIENESEKLNAMRYLVEMHSRLSSVHETMKRTIEICVFKTEGPMTDLKVGDIAFMFAHPIICGKIEFMSPTNEDRYGRVVHLSVDGSPYKLRETSLKKCEKCPKPN